MIFLDRAEKPVNYGAKQLAESLAVTFRAIQGAGDSLIRKTVSKRDNDVDQLVNCDKQVKKASFHKNVLNYWLENLAKGLLLYLLLSDCVVLPGQLLLHWLSQ